MSYSSLTAVGILLATILSFGPSFAAQPPLSSNPPTLTTTPAMSDADIDARYQTATQMLQSQERGAEYWEYGWGTFNAGTMIYSASKAATESNHRNRATNIVQAAESLVGLADVVFRPLPAFNADSVCSDVKTIQNQTECLQAKESLLQRSAERAEEPYEFLPHAGNFAFNAIAGLIVWKVGGVHNAIMTAVPGVAIGEVQLWTTPHEPISDYDRFKVKFSPMIQQSENSKDTTAGFRLTSNF